LVLILKHPGQCARVAESEYRFYVSMAHADIERETRETRWD
jgi:hypothetical protein